MVRDLLEGFCVDDSEAGELVDSNEVAACRKDVAESAIALSAVIAVFGIVVMARNRMKRNHVDGGVIGSLTATNKLTIQNTIYANLRNAEYCLDRVSGERHASITSVIDTLNTLIDRVETTVDLTDDEWRAISASMDEHAKVIYEAVLSIQSA